MEKRSSMLSSALRAPMKRGKYVTVSMAKKAAIIKLVESGRSQADIAKEFHISKRTLSDYIKNKQKILEAAEKCHGTAASEAFQGDISWSSFEELANMSAATREWLERLQRVVGRIAPRCHGTAASEAFQGDISRSSFKEHEAASKLTFHCRLPYMARKRWSRRVFDCLMAVCAPSVVYFLGRLASSRRIRKTLHTLVCKQAYDSNLVSVVCRADETIASFGRGRDAG
ncbi:hypothetical protein HPB50_008198 [Hyalomma asiaticum]|uniref:Uncharacterized protein n=1 Tax=Hyalomma asiaticum TaxID=266040 RepID=A0ACB7SFS4_HYAAI|nr:hypothetical protein HPB50_008198 [Hyalomma asiaticum]